MAEQLLKQYAKIRSRKVEVQAAVPTSTEDKIVGLHVFGNLYDLDPAVMDNLELLKGTVVKAIEMAKMTLVECRGWSFGGKKGGNSVIALITESHVALHIWKEYKYATLDIYTCGESSNPHAAFDYIVKTLKPKRHQLFYADRSMK